MLTYMQSSHTTGYTQRLYCDQNTFNHVDVVNDTYFDGFAPDGYAGFGVCPEDGETGVVRSMIMFIFDVKMNASLGQLKLATLNIDSTATPPDGGWDWDLKVTPYNNMMGSIDGTD